ncbi:MAG TPA: glutathione S-transferase family protein [Burkholderiales bacterium]|nr:glutathione S-transferase family protein [Burkholderiales bacterium]
MGQLIDGQWRDARSDWQIAKGRFVRAESKFRDWVTADGGAGPTGNGGFRAAPGRYHLYVSRACPWAHRTLIFRSLKGLEDIVGLSVVHWHLGREGWTFEPTEGVVADSVNGARLLREIYLKSDPRCTSRVTVPVLWDRERGVIVNNESADIIRMFNSAFDGVGATPGDYYPLELRNEIDALNERIYRTLNNGVYRAGFAATQEAYEEAFVQVFETLDWLEARLGAQRYLAGHRVTEADWRLFTTLVRFDAVYYSHFKCNLRRLVDYPNLWHYARELYQWPGVAATVDLGHIKRHYYGSHEKLNPSGIVPLGPQLDFSAPPSRRA